jgi:hypothetical protein
MKRAADPPILQADESTTVPGRRRRLLPVVTATEATLAAAAVALDLLVPTLVLLAMAAVSLSLRREPLGSLGLRRPTRARRMCVQVLGLSLLWTTLTLTLVLPVVEHLSGERQDLGAFADLEGDLALLVVLWRRPGRSPRSARRSPIAATS